MPTSVASSRRATKTEAITAFKITGQSTGYHGVFRGIGSVEEDSRINRLGQLRQVQRISGRGGEGGGRRNDVRSSGGWMRGWSGFWRVGGRWLGHGVGRQWVYGCLLCGYVGISGDTLDGGCLGVWECD